jgi:hypothetical protein
MAENTDVKIKVNLKSFSSAIKILCLERHIALIESIRSVSEIFEFSEEYKAELDESIECFKSIKADIYFETAMETLAEQQQNANNL